MAKKFDIQKLDDLDRLASQASDTVAARAWADSTKLPVWRDGVVDHIDAGPTIEKATAPSTNSDTDAIADSLGKSDAAHKIAG